MGGFLVTTIRLLVLLGMATLLKAADSFLNDPVIMPIVTKERDERTHTLIRMYFSDLTALASTMIVHTTITEAESGTPATPSVQITVQHHGIWWRDGLAGLPIAPPTSTRTIAPSLVPPPPPPPPPPPKTNPPPPPPPPPKELAYASLDYYDPTKSIRDGTVLVQYDPMQPDGQNGLRPIVRMYANGEVQPDTRWDPLPQHRRKRTYVEELQDKRCGASQAHSTTLATSVRLPDPTKRPPPPPQPAVAGKYTIHLHQQMEHTTSKLEWALLDSNGQQLLPPSTSNSIPRSDRRNEVTLKVFQPTNKDKTDIEFTLHADAGDGCDPQWNVGVTGGDSSAFVAPCTEGKRADYHCDDPKKIGWTPLNAGFERELNCFWQDVGKP